MRIALDAMGGDGAPGVPVQGAVEAFERLGGDFEILLVGDPSAIAAELEGRSYPDDRLHIVAARQVIGMDDAPVEAVRRKRDSSIVRGVQLQKGGEADAFISAGSTGAVAAASILTLGPLPGVDRPAIGALLPTAAETPTLMLDAGANIECRPRQLVQFAHLGHIYIQDIVGVSRPRVGLLNIGEERKKGGEVLVETYTLLEGSGLNFIGNVEGRDIVTGKCDVVVCDGFVGNVLLKFYESVAGFLARLLSRAVADSAASLDLESVYRVLDYTEYGGAPLLGIDGVTIICHGSTPARAIGNAVGVASRSVESHMVRHLRRELSQLANAGG